MKRYLALTALPALLTLSAVAQDTVEAATPEPVAYAQALQDVCETSQSEWMFIPVSHDAPADKQMFALVHVDDVATGDSTALITRGEMRVLKGDAEAACAAAEAVQTAISAG